MTTDSAPSPAFRVVSRTGLVLGGLALAGCVAMGILSWLDTSSSTAAIGVVVAVVLAIPVLVSLALTLAGLRANRRHPADGFALAAVGTGILVVMLLLVGLQLLFGS